MQDIIELEVSLLHSKPLIWRQLVVHSDTTFFELHHIIQIAMGWYNYHMFEFDLEGYRVGMVDEEEKSNGYGSDQLLDSTTVTLKDLITQKKEVFEYLYDFGDNWRHLIKVKNILTVDKSINYPSCSGGEMNCPPEDCGGIDSFYYSLEVLKDKKHDEYLELSEWFGKKYKAEQFDIEKVNKQFKKLDKYISKWISGK